jgi:hypothetical protein
MLNRKMFLAVTLVVLTSAANANVVGIDWNEQGRYTNVAVIEPAGFLEVCGPLQQGQVIDWTFQSTTALDFNIHYHEGDEVVYPARQKGTTELAAQLVIPLDQTYCWMWSNLADGPATINLELKQAGD